MTEPNPKSAIINHQSKILYLFTRTPLHVGAGASVGAIDQPIIRERHTGFPIIPGSGIKGVLAEDALARNDDGTLKKDDNGKPFRTTEGRAVFGHEKPDDKEAKAGNVSFGEAKVLAFPVRSARGSFAFITCPLVLERFQREHGGLTQLKCPSEPDDMHCLAGGMVTLPKDKPTGIVLEEYKFSLDAAFPAEWETELLKLLPDDPVWQVGQGRFVLLGNGDFSHFVKTACEVGQHVSIDPLKGTAKKGALFNLEAVPSETLFFAPLTCLSQSGAELARLEVFLAGKRILQFGGDSTTGLGFCTFKLG